jgi:hypothetical protein
MSEELDFETEFRTAIERVPFVPFTIVLANGDRHRVHHPMMLSMGLDVVTVSYTTFSVTIRFFNIVSFEVHESAVK